MPELLTLSTPITRPSRTGYTILFLSLDWQNAAIAIRVQGSDGVEESFGYAGNEATALMTVLNSANLSTKSLYKRVIEKLQADGHLPAGSVTGSPS